MKLEEAKNRFQGQWIAFKSYDEDNNPEGEVILHKQNRREFDEELIQSGIKNVYITYAGPSFPPGYAALF